MAHDYVSKSLHSHSYDKTLLCLMKLLLHYSLVVLQQRSADDEAHHFFHLCPDCLKIEEEL